MISEKGRDLIEEIGKGICMDKETGLGGKEGRKGEEMTREGLINE